MKKKYKVRLDRYGHITIAVTDKVLETLTSDEWKGMFYPIADKDDAIKTLAKWMWQWPPDFKGNHNLDGIADLTTNDLSIFQDHIDLEELWEDATIEEII